MSNRLSHEHESWRPIPMAGRRGDVETDGGTRCHDLGGGRCFLRDARHRSVPGPRPGRRGLATARPLWRKAGRTTGLGQPDGRPARGDLEVALPERSLRPGQGPDRADPGSASPGSALPGSGDRALECVEPVSGRHRRTESDLRGQGDAIVREAPAHGDGHDAPPGGLSARVARGDRRLAADTPVTRPGNPMVRWHGWRWLSGGLLSS